MHRKLAKVLNGGIKPLSALLCSLLVSGLSAWAAEVSTVEQFVNAMNAGGDVVLQSDIQLKASVFVGAGSVSVDLNGHELIGADGVYLLASNTIAFADSTATTHAAGFNGRLKNVDLYLEGGSASFRKVSCVDAMIVMNEGGAGRKATLSVVNCDFASSVKPSCIEAYGNTETVIDTVQTVDLNASVMTSAKDSCYYAQGANNQLTVNAGFLAAPSPIEIQGVESSSSVVVADGNIRSTGAGAFGPGEVIDADSAAQVAVSGGDFSPLPKNEEWLDGAYFISDGKGGYIARANGILINTYNDAGRFTGQTGEEAQTALADGKNGKFSGFVYSVRNVGGVQVNQVEGTVDITASAPKKGKAKTTIKAKIGKSKVSLKFDALGMVNDKGEYELSGADKKGNSVALTCVDGRYTGTLTAADGARYQIDAVRTMDKKVAKSANGTYAAFVPSPEINGFCVLSLKISSGKAKIAAVTPTGTKLSGSSALYDSKDSRREIAIPVSVFKKNASSIDGLVWVDGAGDIFNESEAGWPMVFTCTEAPHRVTSVSDLYGGKVAKVSGTYVFDTEDGHPDYVKKDNAAPVVKEVLPNGVELTSSGSSFKMVEKGTKPKKVDGRLAYNGPTDSKLSVKYKSSTGMITGNYTAWYESEAFSKSDKVKLFGAMVPATAYNAYLVSLGIEDGFAARPVGLINGAAKNLGAGKKAIKPIPAIMK